MKRPDFTTGRTPLIVLSFGVFVAGVVIMWVSRGVESAQITVLVFTTIVYASLTYWLARSTAGQARFASVPFVDVRIGGVRLLAEDAALPERPEARLEVTVTMSTPSPALPVDLVVMAKIHPRHVSDGEPKVFAAMTARHIMSIRGGDKAAVETVKLEFTAEAAQAVLRDINHTHRLLKEKSPSGVPEFRSATKPAEEFLDIVGGPQLTVRVVYQNHLKEHFSMATTRCLVALPIVEQISYPSTGDLALFMLEWPGRDTMPEPLREDEARRYRAEVFPIELGGHPSGS